MKNNLLILICFLFLPIGLTADNLPAGGSLLGDRVIPSQDDSNKVPGDTVIPDIRGSFITPKKEAPSLTSPFVLIEKAKIEAKKAEISLVEQIVPNQENAKEMQTLNPLMPELVKRAIVKRPRPRKMKSGIKIFQNRNLDSEPTISLPSSSFALATTLYGIEATPVQYRPLLVELKQTWSGPNQAIVEMRGCRLWLNVKGNYATERIIGSSDSMSCRAPNGITFDIPIHAYIIDQKEEYFGAKGIMVAKGKTLASALSFLSDGVNAFGKAMSAAQVTTNIAKDISDTTFSSNSTNQVAGDSNKFIAGSSIAGSTGKFLNWWIEYYSSLEPTVAIGPGKQIFLVIQGSIKIPKIFFGTSFPTQANTSQSLNNLQPIKKEN